jgi:uncharacterized protein YndB with AHSA1/START domain
MNADSHPPVTSDREIVITRFFDAPRELVWEAWTNPTHVVRWWGPRGFTTTIETMDVRPGGQWIHVMHGPDGTRYPNHSVFTEVVKPERIAFQHGGGRAGEPTVDFESTWTFEFAEAGKTRVTIRMVFPTAAARERVVKEFGAIKGGQETLERLAEHLAQAQPAEREIVLTRVFDAPRELVWQAWTDPRHLARWWGPQSFTNPACEADLRPGGAWRITMRAPDGREYPCQGLYREINPPERLVFTNDAIAPDGSVIIAGLTTVLFEELNAQTKLTLRTRGTAMKDFARAYLSGMEMGWSQSLEKLAEELGVAHPSRRG